MGGYVYKYLVRKQYPGRHFISDSTHASVRMLNSFVVNTSNYDKRYKAYMLCW